MNSMLAATLLAVALGATLARVAAQQDHLDEGDPCTHRRLGMAGTCRYLKSCPSALDERKNNINPQICGWRPGYKTPNVCCVGDGGGGGVDNATSTPLDTKRQNSTTVTLSEREQLTPGSVARRKCREYAQAATQGNQCHLTNPGPTPTVHQLITNGVPAKQREFPHMALLGYGQGDDIAFSCGGALIAEQWVLTAAHCLSHPNKGAVTTVLLGELDRGTVTDDALPQQVAVAESFKNDGHKALLRYDDIALLRLERPATLSVYVRPACLHTAASPGVPLNEGAEVYVSGWGVTQYGEDETSPMLLKARLNVASQSSCNETYANQGKLPRGIVDTQLCAGSDSGKDACQGDSGGPLQVFTPDNPTCMYHVVGVVSAGILCGSQYPGLYTRVASYVPWIERTVWPQG